MKVKDITKIGFYKISGNPEIILEVLKNTDKEWLKEKPEDNLIIDEWIYDYTEPETNCRIYQTSGGLFSRYLDYAEIDIEKQICILKLSDKLSLVKSVPFNVIFPLLISIPLAWIAAS